MEQETEQEMEQEMVVKVKVVKAAAVVRNIPSLCSDCLARLPLEVFPGLHRPSPQVVRWISVLLQLCALSSWR